MNQTDWLAEYHAVRTDYGWMRRDDIGYLVARGADRYDWLQGMVSADTRLLAAGETNRLPACILNATGHLISDVALIDAPGDDSRLLIELPRRNLDKIYATLDRLLIMEDVELERDENLLCLSIQGPRAVAPIGGTAVVAADHTGEGGFDWIGAPEDAPKVETIRPETVEALRVEAGIPKDGAELEESVIALEANLGATHISLTKGCYVGQEIIARIDSRGHTNRALTGLLVEAGDLPAVGDRLYTLEENESRRETGRITSVLASSPAMQGQAIALGYVRHEHRAPGSRLQAVGEARASSVIVTELPFYRRNA